MNRLEGSRVQARILQSVRAQVNEQAYKQLALSPQLRGCLLGEEVLTHTRDKLKYLILDTMDAQVRK